MKKQLLFLLSIITITASAQMTISRNGNEVKYTLEDAGFPAWDANNAPIYFYAFIERADTDEPGVGSIELTGPWPGQDLPLIAGNATTSSGVYEWTIDLGDFLTTGSRVDDIKFILNDNNVTNTVTQQTSNLSSSTDASGWNPIISVLSVLDLETGSDAIIQFASNSLVVSEKGNYNTTIYDMNGRIVKQLAIQTNRVNESVKLDLVRGNYFVQTVYKGKVYNLKITKD